MPYSLEEIQLLSDQKTETKSKSNLSENFARPEQPGQIDPSIPGFDDVNSSWSDITGKTDFFNLDKSDQVRVRDYYIDTIVPIQAYNANGFYGKDQKKIQRQNIDSFNNAEALKLSKRIKDEEIASIANVEALEQEIRSAADKKAKPSLTSRSLSNTGDFLGGAARGATSSVLGSIAGVSEFINARDTADGFRKAQQYFATLGVDPDDEVSTASKVGGFTGNLLTFIAPQLTIGKALSAAGKLTGAAKGVVAGTSAAQIGGYVVSDFINDYDSVMKEQGLEMDPEVRRALANRGAATGVLFEVAGPMFILAKANKGLATELNRSFNKSVLKTIGTEGALEAGGAFATSMSKDLAAKQLFDEDREFQVAQAAENATLEGAAGLVVSGLFAALGAKPKSTNAAPDAPTPDAPTPDAPTPDAPTPDAPTPDAPTDINELIQSQIPGASVDQQVQTEIPGINDPLEQSFAQASDRQQAQNSFPVGRSRDSQGRLRDSGRFSDGSPPAQPVQGDIPGLDVNQDASGQQGIPGIDVAEPGSLDLEFEIRTKAQRENRDLTDDEIAQVADIRLDNNTRINSETVTPVVRNADGTRLSDEEIQSQVEDGISDSNRITIELPNITSEVVGDVEVFAVEGGVEMIDSSISRLNQSLRGISARAKNSIDELQADKGDLKDNKKLIKIIKDVRNKAIASRKAELDQLTKARNAILAQDTPTIDTKDTREEVAAETAIILEPEPETSGRVFTNPNRKEPTVQETARKLNDIAKENPVTSNSENNNDGFFTPYLRSLARASTVGGLLAETKVGDYFNKIPIRGAHRAAERFISTNKLSDDAGLQGVYSLSDAVKQQVGGVDKLSAKDVLILNQVLKGDPEAIAATPDGPIKTDLLKKRQEIDTTSQEILTSFEKWNVRLKNLVDSDEVIPTDKVKHLKSIKTIEGHVKAFEDRMGSYTHTAYELLINLREAKKVQKLFLKDPDNALFADTLNTLRAIILADATKRGASLSAVKANSAAIADLTTVFENITSLPDRLDAATNADGMVVQGTTALQRRKRIPPALKELLGEVKDPAVNYYMTVQQQQLIKSSIELADSLVLSGTSNVDPDLNWMSVSADSATGLTSQVNADSGNIGIDLLQGYYISDGAKVGLQDFFVSHSIRGGSGAIQFANRAGAIARFDKTLLSTGTQIANLISSTTMAAMHMPRLFLTPTAIPRTVETVGHIINSNFRDSKKNTPLRKILVGEGVLADSVIHQTNKRAFQDSNISGLSVAGDVEGLSDAGSRVKGLNVNRQPITKRALRLGGRVVSGAFQVGDEIAKGIVWESRRTTLSKATGKSVDHPDVYKEAAVFTRDQTPTYTKVVDAVKKLRNIPLTPDFLTFLTTSVSVSKNIPRDIVRDVTSGNPVLRRDGYLRAVGAVAIGGYLPEIWQAAFRATVGSDENEITDNDISLLQDFRPFYYEGDDLVIKTKYDDGSYDVVNMSRFDQNHYPRSVLGALLKNIHYDYKANLYAALQRFIEPFTQSSVLGSSIVDAVKHYDKAGGTTSQKAEGAAKILVDGVGPTVAKNIQDYISTISDNPIYKRSGRGKSGDDVLSSMLATGVVRIYIPQQLGYEVQTFKRKLEAANREDTQGIVSGRGFSRTDIQAELNSDWVELQTLVGRALDAGYSENDLKKFITSDKKGKIRGGETQGVSTLNNDQYVQLMTTGSPAPTVQFSPGSLINSINRSKNLGLDAAVETVNRISPGSTIQQTLDNLEAIKKGRN